MYMYVHMYVYMYMVYIRTTRRFRHNCNTHSLVNARTSTCTKNPQKTETKINYQAGMGQNPVCCYGQTQGKSLFLSHSMH